ncbi:unnamed protein product, partial [Heligmosomoides polygyrus]|uniref:Col_cuticle_N domain-containing protein n=1 Tax=Heligmosomoides polygyrus TaxID=6339 RepID=A0A183FA75_HELPZ
MTRRLQFILSTLIVFTAAVIIACGITVALLFMDINGFYKDAMSDMEHFKKIVSRSWKEMQLSLNEAPRRRRQAHPASDLQHFICKCDDQP